MNLNTVGASSKSFRPDTIQACVESFLESIQKGESVQIDSFFDSWGSKVSIAKARAAINKCLENVDGAKFTTKSKAGNYPLIVRRIA